MISNTDLFYIFLLQFKVFVIYFTMQCEPSRVLLMEE